MYFLFVISGLRVDIHSSARIIGHLQKHHNFCGYDIIHYHKQKKYFPHNDLLGDCLLLRLQSNQNSLKKSHQVLLRLQILLRESARRKRPWCEHVLNFRYQKLNSKTHRRQVSTTCLLQTCIVIHFVRYRHSH